MLHRIIVGLGVMVAVSQATGQSIPGDFQNLDPWWTGPGGAGVRYDPPTQTIQIDRNCDGITDVSYSRPSGPDGLLGSEQLHLLPSQDVLYAVGSCGSDVRVAFYRIDAPAPGNLQFITSDCIAGSIF